MGRKAWGVERGPGEQWRGNSGQQSVASECEEREIAVVGKLPDTSQLLVVLISCGATPKLTPLTTLKLTPS